MRLVAAVHAFGPLGLDDAREAARCRDWLPQDFSDLVDALSGAGYLENLSEAVLACTGRWNPDGGALVDAHDLCNDETAPEAS